MISFTSSQLARMNPPRPRFDTQSRRFSGSLTIVRHAATGLIELRASRQCLRRRPRTSGYLMRVPE
jgi:hypothetical protein